MAHNKIGILIALVAFLISDCVAGTIFSAVEMRRSKAIVAEELSARTSSPIYHHGLLPKKNVAASWGPLRYRLITNSLGFKDSETRDVVLKEHKFRILFIGDSFTEGLGYEYADTFVGRIGNDLASENIEVLNAGVQSYSPHIFLRKLRYLIEDVGLSFNHVAIFLDLSDIQDDDAYDQGSSSNTQQLEAPLNWKTAAKRYSLSLRLIYPLVKSFFDVDHSNSISNSRDRISWASDLELYQRYGARGLQLAEKNMDAIKELLERHGVGLTLAIYPYPLQIERAEQTSRHTEFWQAWANRNSVRLLNLFPAFMNADSSRRVIADYFVPGDVHWNAAGHAFVAGEFLRFWRGTSKTSFE